MQSGHVKLSMFFFLASYFIIYGGMHFYLYARTKSAFLYHPSQRITVTLFLILMVYAPVIVRLTEVAGMEGTARVSALIGFYWMGLAFLLFSFFILFDLYRIIIFFITIVTKKDLLRFILSAKTVFTLSFIFALAIMFYGSFEARNIRIERWKITSPKIPEHVGRIKIVQITDIHLGLLTRRKQLKTILDKVKQENPDILVSTGDIVDGQVCNLNGLSDLFQEIQPRFGKFAVTGNHEFYAGLENALCFMEESGFIMLRGRAETVGDCVNIAGVDDPAGRIKQASIEISEKKLLQAAGQDNFTLLLKHQPVVDKQAAGLFDLQLSGHTHNGQIFPFTLLTRIFYPVKASCLNRAGSSYMYMSRGTGTWGPPVRFLCPPEITVFEIIRE